MKKLIVAFAAVSLVLVAGSSSAFAKGGGKKGNMDKDGDGFVSKEEFTEAKKAGGMDDEKIGKAFDRADKDSDGKLSAEELEAAKAGGKKGKGAGAGGAE